jgi:hypothetical protein
MNQIRQSNDTTNNNREVRDPRDDQKIKTLRWAFRVIFIDLNIFYFINS